LDAGTRLSFRLLGIRPFPASQFKTNGSCVSGRFFGFSPKQAGKPALRLGTTDHPEMRPAFQADQPVREGVLGFLSARLAIGRLLANNASS